MRETVTESRFVILFEKMDRSLGMGGPNNLRMLFEYLEQFEEDVGEEIEFDPVGLCGDFAFYKDEEKDLACKDFGAGNIDGIEEQTDIIPAHDGFYVRVY